jgi:hypothetical protein
MIDALTKGARMLQNDEFSYGSLTRRRTFAGDEHA